MSQKAAPAPNGQTFDPTNIDPLKLIAMYAQGARPQAPPQPGPVQSMPDPGSMMAGLKSGGGIMQPRPMHPPSRFGYQRSPFSPDFQSNNPFLTFPNYIAS